MKWCIYEKKNNLDYNKLVKNIYRDDDDDNDDYDDNGYFYYYDS
jgi:hypothetical protein